MVPNIGQHESSWLEASGIPQVAGSNCKELPQRSTRTFLSCNESCRRVDSQVFVSVVVCVYASAFASISVFVSGLDRYLLCMCKCIGILMLSHANPCTSKAQRAVWLHQEADLSIHFERSGGGHFERSGGTSASPSMHFERSGGTRVSPSGHCERVSFLVASKAKRRLSSALVALGQAWATISSALAAQGQARAAASSAQWLR